MNENPEKSEKTRESECETVERREKEKDKKPTTYHQGQQLSLNVVMLSRALALNGETQESVASLRTKH